MRAVVAFLAALALLTAPSRATIYTVLPDGAGDFPTIQAGVDAIVDGDVLELGAGTFAGTGNRDVDYRGKAITIRSQSGDPATCLIDCAGTEVEPHRAFHFHSGEPAGAALSGVTITRGWMGDPARGGGICCEDGSSAVLSHCVLTEIRGVAALATGGSRLEIRDCVFSNDDALEGGGVCGEQSTLVLERCRFVENTAARLGGGVHAHAAAVEMLVCEFERNSALHGGAADFHISTVVTARDCRFYENRATEAGCLCLFAGCDGAIEDCTFAGNTCEDWGSALSVGKTTASRLRGCTFYGNAGGMGALMIEGTPGLIDRTLIAFNDPGLAPFSGVVMACCDIFGNDGGDWIGLFADQYGANGNICADPLFCDPEQRDFRLDATSPCAPQATPGCDLIGAWPVGCGGTPADPLSWGRVKAAFR